VGIISWLILGLIAGFIGSRIVSKSGKGFFLDVALGIVGAVVGGSLFSLLGAQGITGLNVYDRRDHWLCRGALGLSRRDRSVIAFLTKWRLQWDSLIMRSTKASRREAA